MSKKATAFKKQVSDLAAPYHAYKESDDTEEMEKSRFLKGVKG